MMKDDIDFTNKMTSEGSYYLGCCLDVRSSTKSVQRKQLFSNAKIANSDEKCREHQRVREQDYCKKKARNNKKIFLLKFNDLLSSHKEIGKGMVVSGKTHQGSVKIPR